MAKKERKARKPRIGSPANLPAGFEAVEAAKFPTNHDFRDRPLLQGRVTEIKTVPGRGKPRRILYVADSQTGELSAVWENTMLASLFARVRVNDEIYIKFTHSEAAGGKKKVEEFVTGIKGA